MIGSKKYISMLNSMYIRKIYHMSYDPMAFLSKLSALCNIIFKILFCIKTLEFSENVGLFYGFFLKNPAKIEVLTRKFQGMSMIRETAKIKNANFEGAKIEVKV